MNGANNMHSNAGHCNLFRNRGSANSPANDDLFQPSPKNKPVVFRKTQKGINRLKQIEFENDMTSARFRYDTFILTITN
ncbi:hypothetical protein SAMN05444274_102193 [Mariniphaga anaerophila]|uniref:Uncharacterized protein n=1 Tax=Mariniphaga anaerophila TaxID=1484053 RepID=A0A1M4VS41_9BACT|nr:hypothetical protein SAMN05444274_102193 [Mariniphaga anaerophila]